MHGVTIVAKLTSLVTQFFLCICVCLYLCIFSFCIFFVFVYFGVFVFVCTFCEEQAVVEGVALVAG